MIKQRDNEQGMALLLATIFVAIAIFTLGAVMVGVVNESRQVRRFESYEICMYGIESAIATSMESISTGTGGMMGVAAGSGFDPMAEDPFSQPGVTPLTMAQMPGLEFFAFSVDWSSDGTDNNGDGTIDGTDELLHYTVYGYARHDGTMRRVEQVVKGEDVNVWRNAIFAGAGQAGGLINGNVSIHGSVHLLGDNVLQGGQVLAALDMSGASLIHNNYQGLYDPNLLQRIPPLPTKTFDGETVETLEATLRVKKGLVGISGSSEIGSPNVAGNGIKETMDGTYVSDGWTGNRTIDDGARGIPTVVYSDNGWDETYDLGDRVPMPLLQDAWRDPSTGDKQWDDSRNQWYTHENYFREVLVGDPNLPNDGIINGNVTIRTDSNYYYNASRPADSNPANRQAGDDYIFYNASTNNMEVNGQIYINGDLSFEGKGSKRSLTYTGRAAVLVNGEASIGISLLSLNANGTSARSFPEANFLGLMAAGDLLVGTNSQLSVLGAFYSQSTVSSAKQTTILGTLVGTYFDMGTNVPDIYQVPALADNLPLGMIANFPIMTLSVLSWRELGI